MSTQSHSKKSAAKKSNTSKTTTKGTDTMTLTPLHEAGHTISAPTETTIEIAPRLRWPRRPTGTSAGPTAECNDAAHAGAEQLDPSAPADANIPAYPRRSFPRTVPTTRASSQGDGAGSAHRRARGPP